MNTSIRPAHTEDIPALQALLKEVLEVHVQGRPDIFKANSPKYTPEELKSLLADPARPIFVAVEGKQVIGHAFCEIKESQSRNLQHIRTLYIDDLCVSSKVRAHGVGSALYHFIQDYARAQKCVRITLHAWTLNESALKFYEHLGMKPYMVALEEIVDTEKHI